MDMSVQDRLTGVVAAQPFALVPNKLVFFSQRGLPENAGKAVLQFANGNFKDIKVPERVGSVIVFPSRAGELVYHTLRGDGQFLVEINSRAFFGGTDDDKSVFLTEVTKEAFQAFVDGGEYGFYESLKPNELKELEEENPNSVTKRQGDIFAFWCPEFGESAEWILPRYTKMLEEGEKLSIEVQQNKPIFGTRHSIVGQSIMVKIYDDKNECLLSGSFCTGELRAPDHPSLNLGTRPYQMFLAVNFVRGCGDR